MMVGPIFLKKPILVPAITIPTAVLNLILNYLLIPTYGKIGAALASEISMVVCSILTTIYAVRVSNIGYRFGRMFLYATLSSGLSLLVFLDHLFPFYLYLLLKIALGVIIGSIVLFLTRRRLLPLYQTLLSFKKNR